MNPGCEQGDQEGPRAPCSGAEGVNDLALWDNMAFQHYAVRDYHGNRVLQKAYVQGEKPVGSRG